jgi:hypothetical protein
LPPLWSDPISRWSKPIGMLPVVLPPRRLHRSKSRTRRNSAHTAPLDPSRIAASLQRQKPLDTRHEIQAVLFVTKPCSERYQAADRDKNHRDVHLGFRRVSAIQTRCVCFPQYMNITFFMFIYYAMIQAYGTARKRSRENPCPVQKGGVRIARCI